MWIVSEIMMVKQNKPIYKHGIDWCLINFEVFITQISYKSCSIDHGSVQDPPDS